MLKTPPKAKVIACGINDSAEEAHDRPKAYGAFTFNHFLSNVAVELQGKQGKAYPGDCLSMRAITLKNIMGRIILGIPTGASSMDRECNC